MDAVRLLQDLLRIDTTNPPGNEGPAAELLERSLQEAGAETEILTSPAGRASLVARVPGPRDRPALLLLSHTDVVAIEPDSWTRDPFGGEIHDGAVWGRGALDMKGIGVMHAAAVAGLASGGTTPRRELIFAAVADEEAGGREGAAWLLREHAALLGFGDNRPPPEALGEGGFGLAGILERPLLPVVVGEKHALKLDLVAAGDPGHGSLPPRRQAPRDLGRFIARVTGYGRPRIHPVLREQFAAMAETATGGRRAVFSALASRAGDPVAALLQKQLRNTGALGALLSDTVAVTLLRAGYKDNVVPGAATATLDCRLLPDTSPDDFVHRIATIGRRYNVTVTRRDQGGGPVSGRGELFPLLEEASRALPESPLVFPSLTPGFTDLRYLRRLGAQAYGWVPLVIDAELLGTIHGHDERIPVAGFHKAVAVMTEVVERACI